ncbi:hypothetical protein BC835DRAFT_1330200, partial [Cytidiella melzeri]
MKHDDGVPVAKRKLSLSATADEQAIKRTRSGQGEATGDSETIELPVQESKAVDNEKSVESGSCTATFYLWSKAISDMLEHREADDVRLHLKSAVLEAWSRMAHLTEVEKSDCVEEYTRDVYQWDAELRDDEEPEGVDALMEVFREKLAKRREHHAKHKNASSDEKGEDKMFHSYLEWWELVLHRERPTGGAPAMEIKLKSWHGGGDTELYSGWWMTDFVPADDDAEEAMDVMIDTFCL